MRLLVTGGAGFIGSNFIRYFLNVHADCAITNLDKLTYAGNLENLIDVQTDSRYRFIKGDIADRALVENVLSEGYDAIVNFAAESHVDRSIEDATPFLDTNVKGTQVLLEGARKYRLIDLCTFPRMKSMALLIKVCSRKNHPFRPAVPTLPARQRLTCCAFHTSRLINCPLSSHAVPTTSDPTSFPKSSFRLLSPTHLKISPYRSMETDLTGATGFTCWTTAGQLILS